MNSEAVRKLSMIKSQKDKKAQASKESSEQEHLAAVRLSEAGFPMSLVGDIYLTRGAYGDGCVLTVTSPFSLRGHTREEILGVLEVLQSAGHIGEFRRVSFRGFAPSIIHGNVVKTLVPGQRLEGTFLTAEAVAAIQPLALRVDELGVKVKVPLSLEGFPSLTLVLPSSLEEFSGTLKLSGYIPSRGKYAREKYLDLPGGKNSLCLQGVSLDVYALPSPDTSEKGAYDLTWSAERQMTPSELFGAAFCSELAQEERPEDSSGMSMGS